VSRTLSGTPPHRLGPAPARARVTIELEDAGDSPILRGYREVRERFPEAIVLVRLGDFYEMFGPDAEAASPILGIALTGRGFGNAGRVPMCGVPQHSLSNHLKKLLDAGRHVVIWDQVGEAEAGKLVRREVTRVLSPGMVVEDELLEPAAALRCVTAVEVDGRTGIAALDPSTGDMHVMQIEAEMRSAAVLDECTGLNPAELVFADGVETPATLGRGLPRTVLPLAFFDLQSADRRLKEACGTGTLAALDMDDIPVARRAAGALLAYCERSRIAIPPGFIRVTVRRAGDTMRLDPQTRRNLELTGPLAGSGPSLMALMDRTCTSIGTRLLRARLHEPLTDVAPLDARLDAVGEMIRCDGAVLRLRDALRRCGDLERFTARCVQGIATPRNLAAVRDVCALLPEISAALSELTASDTVDARERCTAPPTVLERLGVLLVEDPPPDAHDGGSIRPGADEELDSLHAASGDARSFIEGLEQRERQRTGIRSLRVGYNRVFGYYIEVPNAHRDAAPSDYMRKQTLVGAERYITPELKEQETIVMHARERSVAREIELLRDACALVAEHAPALLGAAAALGMLDVTQSLAQAAVECNWTRPELDDSPVIDIEDGRHPLVEHALGAGRFVPNDCSLDAAARILVLTGPNMAGKSTYLRQVATIVLMAQVGSFVPAQRARLGLCDRIFTRVGAHDDLSGGMSTFMVEMAETAAILRQATGRSLVILDEIGRGTSTYDGLSIAQAVVEHLHESPRLNCRTLFATHYHELTGVAEHLPRVHNARVEVVEEGDRVTFLHRIVPGGADRSYGIHVARLAGVPASVLLRARQVLSGLERSMPLTAGHEDLADQLSLPITAPAPLHVIDELAELDIDSLTPIAALNKLAELRRQAVP
jgi:DNA mismatch repair protein MutS